jgi:hypothetical protein
MEVSPCRKRDEQGAEANLVGQIAALGDGLRRVGEGLEWMKRDPRDQECCYEEHAADQQIGIDRSADRWASCRHQIEV